MQSNLLFVSVMAQTFSDATDFDQPLGNWNTSSATSMHFMFARATVFNKDISGWNVGNVQDFSAVSMVVFCKSIHCCLPKNARLLLKYHLIFIPFLDVW